MEENKNPQENVPQEDLDKAKKLWLLVKRREAYYEERTRQLEESAKKNEQILEKTNRDLEERTRQMKESAKQNEQGLEKTNQDLEKGKVKSAKEEIFNMMVRQRGMSRAA